jgi:ABC-type phosphate transport system substrate-binding protein
MTPPAVSVLLAAVLAGASIATTEGLSQRPAALADAIAIIVHRSNPTEDLSFRELRRIFMLERQTWRHGRKITVVLRESGQPERAEAIRLICGMSEQDYDRHLLLQTLRGTITQGPREIRTAEAMIRFIFNAPGAIGYVPANAEASLTKVLRIDGLLPGDPKYPLQRQVASSMEP